MSMPKPGEPGYLWCAGWQCAAQGLHDCHGSPFWDDHWTKRANCTNRGPFWDGYRAALRSAWGA
jgi:hypothetical protein